MSYQSTALIVLVTWAVLLAIYFVNRFLVRSSFLTRPIVVLSDGSPDQARKPGSLLAGAGVLFVFLVNIAALLLLLVASLVPWMQRYVSPVRVELPLWANIIGSVLFVLYSLWGLGVLLFNPNYTPLFSGVRARFLLATEGPYALVRHARYTAEALLNVALFLFTGVWIPLLGILAWAGIRDQARREEEYLRQVAGEEYDAYCRRTGRFFPRLK